jgi:hypothetical protein
VSQGSSPPIGVTIVVDRTFGARLIALARARPVWVVTSAANSAFVDQARAVAGASITTFDDDTCVAPDSLAAEFLGSVLEHHPLAAKIEIVGCTATQILRRALQGAGLSLVSEDAGSVVAVRPLTIGSSDRGAASSVSHGGSR